jgi:hypothetical protein
MVEAVAGPELCGPRPAPLDVFHLCPPTLRSRLPLRCGAPLLRVEGVEAEEHLLHHGLPKQHPLRLIGPKQREDREWEVVSLGDDLEMAINGLELTPGRRGGNRAPLVVSGRGRGVDAAVLEVQRRLLVMRRQEGAPRNESPQWRNEAAVAGECWRNEAAASGRYTVRAEESNMRTVSTFYLQ